MELRLKVELQVLLLSLLTIVGAEAQCYSGGEVAGIAIGTAIGTLALVGIIIGIVLYRKSKQKKQNPALTPKSGKGVENGHDNPAFADDADGRRLEAQSHAEKGFGGYVHCIEYEGQAKNHDLHTPDRSNGEARSKFWSPEFSVLSSTYFGSNVNSKSGSRSSLDDGFPLDVEGYGVSLESQDIIGLGFNICGSMRDGIFIREVLNRGPASESGKIKAGDRIKGLWISFENMVFEDALTILSYASPYPVHLRMQKAAKSLTEKSNAEIQASTEVGELYHPFSRSQSMDDVSKIGKEGQLIMRRARSEMKRGSNKSHDRDSLGSGRLRKWTGQEAIDFNLQKEHGGDHKPHGIVMLDMNSSDLRMDARDRFDADIHHEDIIVDSDIKLRRADLDCAAPKKEFRIDVNHDKPDFDGDINFGGNISSTDVRFEDEFDSEVKLEKSDFDLQSSLREFSAGLGFGKSDVDTYIDERKKELDHDIKVKHDVDAKFNSGFGLEHDFDTDVKFGGVDKDMKFGGKDLDVNFGGKDADMRFGGPNIDGSFGGNDTDVRIGAPNVEGNFGGKDIEARFGRPNVDGDFGGNADVRFGGPDVDMDLGGRDSNLKFGRPDVDVKFDGREIDPDLRIGKPEIDADLSMGRPGIDSDFGVNKPGIDTDFRMGKQDVDADFRMGKPDVDADFRMGTPDIDTDFRVGKADFDSDFRVRKPDVDTDFRMGKPDVDTDFRMGKPDVDADFRMGKPDIDADFRMGKPDVDADFRMGKPDVDADFRMGKPDVDADFRMGKPDVDADFRMGKPDVDADFRMGKPDIDTDFRVGRPGIDTDFGVGKPDFDTDLRIGKPDIDADLRMGKPGIDSDFRMGKPDVDTDFRMGKPDVDTDFRMGKPDIDTDFRIGKPDVDTDFKIGKPDIDADVNFDKDGFDDSMRFGRPEVNIERSVDVDFSHDKDLKWKRDVDLKVDEPRVRFSRDQDAEIEVPSGGFGFSHDMDIKKEQIGDVHASFGLDHNDNKRSIKPDSDDEDISAIANEISLDDLRAKVANLQMKELSGDEADEMKLDVDVKKPHVEIAHGNSEKKSRSAPKLSLKERLFGRKRRNSASSQSSESSNEDREVGQDSDKQHQFNLSSGMDLGANLDVGREEEVTTEKSELSFSVPQATAVLGGDAHLEGSVPDVQKDVEIDVGRRRRRRRSTSSEDDDVRNPDDIHLRLDQPGINASSRADVDDSMIVNVSHGSLAQRNDTSPSQDVDVGEDSIQSVLMEYLSDQPDMLKRLGFSSDGDSKSVEVTKQEVDSDGRRRITTTTTTTTTTRKQEGSGEIDISVLNGKALTDAKREIRRRYSTSSEDEKGHSSPSWSSRSNSPDHEKPTVALQMEQHAEVKHQKSNSPDIKRRSAGGLAYDITATDLADMSVDVEERPRGEHTGGIAYYVDIQDRLNADPLEMSVDLPSADQNVAQPSLIRAEGIDDFKEHLRWEHDESSPPRRRRIRPESNHIEDLTWGDDDGVVTTKTTTRYYEVSSKGHGDSDLGGMTIGDNKSSSYSLKLNSLNGGDEDSDSQRIEVRQPSGIRLHSGESSGSYSMTVDTHSLDDSEA